MKTHTSTIVILDEAELNLLFGRFQSGTKKGRERALDHDLLGHNPQWSVNRVADKTNVDPGVVAKFFGMSGGPKKYGRDPEVVTARLSLQDYDALGAYVFGQFGKYARFDDYLEAALDVCPCCGRPYAG